MTDCSLSPVVPYALINCHGDVQGDAEVVLKAKQTLFKVRLARQPPEEFDQSETVEGKFLKRLANRRTAEIAREDLADFLGPLCQPFFKSYARYFGDSLKSHLKNPEVFLQLVTDKGVPKVFKVNGDLPCSDIIHLSLETDPTVPCYQLSDATVIETIIDDYIFKVIVHGDIFICKMSRRNATDSFERELDLLQRLSSLEVSDHLLRVPRLGGMIGFEEGFPGILLMDIGAEYSLWDIDVGAAEAGERRKWACQIRDSVKLLHRNDIVWGDVKAENVLIDSQRNAWLIDFGGGCTEGWVSEELCETKEGDLQGLMNIDKFLGL